MNFLIIIGDDLRFDEVPYMPNTRRLFRGAGTDFTACRCNAPVCGPTRAGIITGQLSKDHGIGVGGAVNVTTTQWNNSTFKALDNAGYRVGHIGKLGTDSDGGTLRAGFDFWRALQNSATSNPLWGFHDAWDYEIYDGTTQFATGLYQEHYLAQQGIDFIVNGTEPWVLQYCTTGPHWPWQDPPDHETEWSLHNFPITVEADVSDKPSWVQSRDAVTDQVLREIRDDQRHRLRELIAFDNAVGALVNAVEATGQADDTLIFFTSDNGMMLGEHRFVGGGAGGRAVVKDKLYEPALRVPLFVRGPGFGRGTNDVPVWHQDIVATMMDLGSATPLLGDQAGVSLVDIVATPGAYSTRQLLHYTHDGGSGGPADGISDSQYKLVRHQGETGTDEFELYDLTNDPHELTNRANDGGAWATLRDSLEADLDGALA